MRSLHTTLCTLEPQVADHAADLFEVLSDPAIYEFERGPPESAAWLRERFARLEERQSPDGSELWLNWVVRLASGELAGYVQATVLPGGASLVAYELASRYWRRGIGRSALTAVQDELRSAYDVQILVAVLKAANFRSLGLLTDLGFEPASQEQTVAFGAATDEIVRLKSVGAARTAGPTAVGMAA